ncbi:MAG: phosphoglycerate dehydrogenase [Aestuariivirga sp.]|uniref:NAD(P)-dependent oxidoreductase n=1 Tax=Aestuariivirga sp. TaxID=2650926 RepID=UPI0025B900E5|nr:NAD(P)-dependent oxidoreductase [Aestuariivirga sp.]MCA3562509.1 phosphoglycerate dehydrogenase [Aestuariivirga sp.]
MSADDQLRTARDESLKATAGGPPPRTQNPFFGVGPITDMARDEADSRMLRFAFEHWLEQTYRKLDDTGRDTGPFTAAEIGRSMHRGYPADKFLLDMMREIHRYFEFPKSNRLAVGLGGGHSGFTVCALHVLTVNDPAQHVYVDTPAPESELAKASGFFRQSWGAQIVEMMRYARNGDEARLHFARAEGAIPSSDMLERLGVKVFFGVGHETTGATTYSRSDIENLIDWIDRNPAEHHAVLDATSMLGAMPWGEALVAQVMSKCCLFMPFQKAIGGVSGYFLVSFTPHALALVEENQKKPSWAIPRQLKLAAPVDPKMPLTGERKVNLGPFYDPQENRMVGGVINTFSTIAFAETTFGLLRVEKMIGPVKEMNRRSELNRAALNEWMSNSDLFQLGVTSAEHRGAAVTLIKVTDGQITDPALHARIVAHSKQLLAYDGITHPNGVHEEGLDVARYINAFPGTPGDYRAWIGGIRPVEDIPALLDSIKYAYHRARIVVMEEELAKHGVTFPGPDQAEGRVRKDDPKRAYKVLICDHVGLKFGKDGKPDHSAVKAHVAAQGSTFHDAPYKEGMKLSPGIHFFYQPQLSKPDEIRQLTGKGQYDAVIAAATFLPKEAQFSEGGVRIGAGTGNMGSASWGGGNGEGGVAPLMNTPSFNSRATAQMGFKALLKVLPDLPVDEMHTLTAAGQFDTGRDLAKFPTEKIEGKRIGIIGYGNIGREMAKLAQAFGMVVAVHARPRHKEWIESEGFIFAATPEDAAKGADVVSVHTGLGPLNAATGKFANANVVNSSVLAQLNDGAIVLNYDRGECVDAAALDAAMASGKVRHAAIDADLFVNEETGATTGPMVPYLPLARKYPGRVELLPHAAADTEHVSRVEGAKQAVDQIISAIRFREVVNLKGDLPDGYTLGGSRTVAGVGKCNGQTIAQAVETGDAMVARNEAEAMAAIWAALTTASTGDALQMLVARHGAALVKSFNSYSARMRKLGLEGPYA